jgi:hypothetical protein
VQAVCTLTIAHYLPAFWLISMLLALCGCSIGLSLPANCIKCFLRADAAGLFLRDWKHRGCCR